jgi:hypothetical protein
MYRKLLLASAAAALMTSAGVAQTVNNAPQNSPAGVEDQMKQAPRTGDSSQVGGTPSANTRAVQSQTQSPGPGSGQTPHPTAPSERNR